MIRQMVAGLIATVAAVATTGLFIYGLAVIA